MAKPDNPGKSDKDSKQTVERWVGKGWTALTIPAGSTDPVDVSYDPETQDLAVKRQLFYATTGQHITGHGKPKIVVEMAEAGGTIALKEAADADVVVLYKVTDEEEDEEIEAPRF